MTSSTDRAAEVLGRADGCVEDYRSPGKTFAPCDICRETAEELARLGLLADTAAAKAEGSREAQLADERAARKIAGDAADRFRDVLSECLGHDDENPGDDTLVREVRAHFDKTGPEPTRWRDFCTAALARAEQVTADTTGPAGGAG